MFIGGLIPALVFKGLTRGKKFIGWAKIRIEREIETAVNKYSDDIASDDTIRDDRFRPILYNQWI